MPNVHSRIRRHRGGEKPVREAQMEKLLGMQRAWRSMAQVGAALALVLPAGKAAAQANVDTHMPISAVVTNPCTGEAFQGSGFIHIKIFESFDPNYHVSMEANVESFQGVTASGVMYVLPEQLASHTIADSNGLPVNATDEEMAQIIRQGEDGSLVMGDDFFVRISSHFTYNGNGDLTADFSNVTTECR
jgi:hypothetical protein